MVKTILIIAFTIVVGGLVSFFVMGRLSKNGSAPGLVNGKLAPLPDSPNAVSSDAEDSIEPLRFSDDPSSAWERAKSVINQLPHATIVSETETYLAVECRSPLFGFVDDLELHLRPEDKIIAMRSASRIGHSDMGANEERVEKLRERFNR